METNRTSNAPSSQYLVDMKFDKAAKKPSEYVVPLSTPSETNVTLPGGNTALKVLCQTETFGNVVYKATLTDGSLLYVGEKDGQQIALTVADVEKLKKELKSSTSEAASSISNSSVLSVTCDDVTSTFSRLSTADSCTMLTGAEKSDSAHTAFSQTMLTAAEASDAARTAMSRDCLTAELLSSAPITAQSRTMLTGAEASDAARTAMSRDMLTAAHRSDSAHTAYSQTILTAAEASDPARTAMSRDALTAAQLSTAPMTANSRTLLTGAEASDLAHTAWSQTMLTAADKSASTHTAFGSSTDLRTAISQLLLTAAERSASLHTANQDSLRSSSSCMTADNGLENAVLHTAWELGSEITAQEKSADVVTAIDVIASAFSPLPDGSIPTVHQLTHTPLTDERIATIQPSVEKATQ